MSQTKDHIQKPVPWRQEDANKPEQLPTASQFVGAKNPQVAVEEDPLIGEQIDKWTLVRHLGQGGMAVVYEVEHVWLAQKAAIKLLRPSVSSDLVSLERFRREALMVSQLSHPNIIDIKDFGEDPEHSSYMVMELLEGQDLAQLTTRPEAPHFRGWLLSLCQQICDALDAIHALQIVHRDLKPSNIFLVPDNPNPYPHIKVLDFGVAKATLDQSDGALTSTGLVLGTPHYLAPEQLKTRQALSPATDIYALGVVLYELLTGQLPLLGEGPFEHMLLVAQQTPPALGSLVPGMSGSALEALLAQMLEKDPTLRPASGAEAMAALREAVASLPELAPGKNWAHHNPVTPPPSPTSLRSLSAAMKVPATPPPRSRITEGSTPLVSEAPTSASSTSQKRSIRQKTAVIPTSTAALPLSQAHTPAPSAPRSLRQILLFSLGTALMGMILVASVFIWRAPRATKTPTPHQPQRATQQPAPRAHSTTQVTLAALVTRGTKAAKSGRTRAAIQAWRQAIQRPAWRRHPSHPGLHKSLAHAYATQKNWFAALHFLRRYQQSLGTTPTKRAALTKQMQQWQRLWRAQDISAQRLLARLRQQLKHKRWLLAYTTYQQHQRGGLASPKHQRALVALLQQPFPALALSLQQRLLEKGVLSPAARKLLAKTVARRQRWSVQSAKRAETVWTKRWEKLHAQAKVGDMRHQKPQVKGGHKRSYPLVYIHNHKGWLRWLHAAMKRHPMQRTLLWQWHIAQLKMLHRTHRWPWLRQQYKRLPIALELQAQDAALLAYLRWYKGVAALRKALVKGKLRQALRQHTQVVRHFAQWAPHQAAAKPWGITPSTARRQSAAWTRDLPALIALARQCDQLSARGRFAQAEVRRKAWLALMQEHPARPAIARKVQRQRTFEARLQQGLQRANKAYKRGQWQRARLAYKAFLQARPRAWNAPMLKQRRKACRCALNLFPWEICQRRDFPPNFRAKPTNP